MAKKISYASLIVILFYCILKSINKETKPFSNKQKRNEFLKWILNYYFFLKWTMRSKTFMCVKVNNRACACNQKENLLNKTGHTILCLLMTS
jgi:hypothetical protein